MRKVSFRVRNFGTEQFLTFNIDNEADLDEELLDYLEEEEPKGLVPVIFDDEEEANDTFSYNITNKIHLSELSNQEIGAEMVLMVMRGLVIALNDMAEYRVPLSYLVFNRNYIYIDADYKVEFICIPLEDMKEEADVNAFLRGFIASLRFDVLENGAYVAKLLSYINNPNFTLHNFQILIEDIMEDWGIEVPVDGESEIYADYQEVEEEPEQEMDEAPVEDEDELEEADIAETVEDEKPLEMQTEEPLTEEESDEADDIEVAGVGEEEIAASEAAVKAKFEQDAQDMINIIKQQVKEDEVKREQEVIAAAEEDEAEQSAGVEDSSEETVQSETEAPKEKKKKPIKTKETSASNVMLQDELDKYLEEKELEEEVRSTPREETGLKIKKGIKVNRASIVKNTQDEINAEKEAEAELLAEAGKEVEAEEEEAVSTSILSQAIGMTGILKQNTDIPKVNPYLIRVNTNERIMITKQTFKIGKASMGVDYTVQGNGAVSRVHAIITNKDEVYYVKDNKSTNHTFVNGKIVQEGEQELLTHDSKIVLGDEEFIFKLR